MWHDFRERQHKTWHDVVDESAFEKQRPSRRVERAERDLDARRFHFERTVDSGDPFESLTRQTKKLWRGLID
jgi:hypothetical protein